MKKKSFWLRCLLAPLSFLYGIVVSCRNFFFDIGWLPSRSYPIPVICVGNISVGGTGKTPHVEHIIELLKDNYRIAVLTRGYKRKSTGLIIASEYSTVEEIGDEARQMQLKYPNITLAVDGNRRRAMDYLLNLDEEKRPEVVIMDDGFQHRYIKPSFSILLVDINRPIDTDSLLPLGNLRESATARYRADMLILTKKPKSFKPIDRVLFERRLDLYKYQHLYFSSISYLAPRPLLSIGQAKDTQAVHLDKHSSVFAVSGIARPEIFIEEIKQSYTFIAQRCFTDHHNFTRKELEELNETYANLNAELTKELYFVCTEKDAVRLFGLKDYLSKELLEHFYYLPIAISMDGNRDNEFNTLIKQAADALLPTLH